MQIKKSLCCVHKDKSNLLKGLRCGCFCLRGPVCVCFRACAHHSRKSVTGALSRRSKRRGGLMTSARTTDGKAALMPRLVGSAVLLPIHTHTHIPKSHRIRPSACACVLSPRSVCVLPVSSAFYKASLLSLVAYQPEPGNPMMPTKHLMLLLFSCLKKHFLLV